MDVAFNMTASDEGVANESFGTVAVGHVVLASADGANGATVVDQAGRFTCVIIAHLISLAVRVEDTFHWREKDISIKT